MTFARDRVAEWMDDPAIAQDEHLAALSGLRRLNRISQVAGPTFQHLLRFAGRKHGQPLRVLDVASGGGDVPIQWAVMAKRRQVPMQITTTDISQTAVDRQAEMAAKHGVRIQTLLRDVTKVGLPDGFDVATCTLFMHHLDDAAAARLLQSMQRAADGLLVCDLERSRVNWWAVWLASRLVTRSKIVHHDATASVRAAYTVPEFRELAERALARPVRCFRLMPCRFLLRVDELAVDVAAPAFA